jgi:hypothetical protein
MHSDADWVIDKHPIGQASTNFFLPIFRLTSLLQITVVAELFYHAAYATNRNFGIDDGTARMEVKMWLETPEDQLDAIWRGLTLSKHPYVPLSGGWVTDSRQRTGGA